MAPLAQTAIAEEEPVEVISRTVLIAGATAQPPADGPQPGRGADQSGWPAHVREAWTAQQASLDARLAAVYTAASLPEMGAESASLMSTQEHHHPDHRSPSPPPPPPPTGHHRSPPPPPVTTTTATTTSPCKEITQILLANGSRPCQVIQTALLHSILTKVRQMEKALHFVEEELF